MKTSLAAAKLVCCLRVHFDAGSTVYYDHDHSNPTFADVLDEKSLSDAVEYLCKRGAISLQPVYKCAARIDKGVSFDDTLTELIEIISKDHDDLSSRLEAAEQQVKEERCAADARVNHIVSFDLSKLRAEVKDIESKLAEISGTVSSTPELNSLTGTLSKLKENFSLIAKMSSDYEDIYAGIIRPVQAEGKTGIRATKKWAILSIVASAILSTAASVAVSAYFATPSSLPQVECKP